MDLKSIQTILPNHPEHLFLELSQDGKISKVRFNELLQRLTDSFCSHDWGKDELDRSNHARVMLLVAELKNQGLTVWMDEEQMKANVKEQMVVEPKTRQVKRVN